MTLPIFLVNNILLKKKERKTVFMHGLRIGRWEPSLKELHESKNKF